MADKKFAMAAAQGGIAEVKLGELAAKQGSSEKVKDFGQKMVDDHGKANEDLKSVAQARASRFPPNRMPSRKPPWPADETARRGVRQRLYQSHEDGP